MAERQAQVAALNMMGHCQSYIAVPFFWTERLSSIGRKFSVNSPSFEKCSAFEGAANPIADGARGRAATSSAAAPGASLQLRVLCRNSIFLPSS
jgi:hypothetical protein